MSGSVGAPNLQDDRLRGLSEWVLSYTKLPAWKRWCPEGLLLAHACLVAVHRCQEQRDRTRSGPVGRIVSSPSGY
jgi:hypothetical protein